MLPPDFQAPMPKFDDRFARQNRYEPPPEFPLASPYAVKDHQLSGLDIYALTQTFRYYLPGRSMVRRWLSRRIRNRFPPRIPMKWDPSLSLRAILTSNLSNFLTAEKIL